MYSDSISQLRDYGQLISVYLGEYMDSVVRKRAVTDTPFEKYKGLVVSLEEAENAFSPAPFSLSEKGKDAAAAIWREISESSAASEEQDIIMPLDRICTAFGFGMLERFIIALAALPLVDPMFEKTFGYICDNVRISAPTIGLALDLFAGGDYSRLGGLSQPLLKYLFQPFDGNPLRTPLVFRGYFTHLLTCGEFRRSSFMHAAYPDEIGTVCYEPQLALMENAVSSGGKRVVCLCGEKGSGRQHLVSQLAAKHGRGLLTLDPVALARADRLSAETDIVCDLLLRQCFVCVTGVDGNADRELMKWLFEVLFRAAGCVFVCADSVGSLPEIPQPVLPVKLEELPRSIRRRLWLDTGICSEELAQTAANKYRFDPAKIMTSAARARERMTAEGLTALSGEMLDEICAETAENAFRGKARLIRSKFTMDDLILPAEEKQLIREACAQIKYRHIVFDRWNFESRLAYGKGLTMLFAGPPGTGKTMAATIVGGELGLPVYRVDISQVMSKYIGETEKSLGEIFDAAEHCGAVLFFDETDALFGKRSEIKDSHDKYANVETSFLLQRLESFEGVVLMATNLLQNIDEAFIRRISCVINFPLPDAQQRLALWQSMFPPEMPRDGGIDFEFLAEQFELSGAAIKNAVMSAAFLAAEEEAPVSMAHILRAVRKQFSKQGKLLLKNDFGKYAVFF